jgi:hypothetical protein
MLSPQALVRGLVQRALPSFNPDSANNDVAFRQWPYGEQAVMSLVRKSHVLADEGTYFIANNAQTGIVPTYGTAFSATAPFISIYNGNTNNQRLYLDYIALVAIAAGLQTTTAGYTAAAVVIDNINRFTSGGTAIGAGVNANMASSNASGATINCGAILAPAASGAARTLVGVRNLRPSVSTTVINVVGDMNLLNFGSVEGAVGSITIANANIMPQAMPPVVIAPGHTALLYLWFPVMTAPSAATYAPEIGFWVR